MGVINVTPDSFSDGGVHLHVEAAVTEAWGMLDSGASIVDVGGESTRPGSTGVSAAEELQRIEQVLIDLAGAPVSVDTSKAAVRAPCPRARRRARQRRDRSARRSRAGGRRRRRRLLSLPDAHAGRATHDAGRPHVRRRRLGRQALPRGATRLRVAAGVREELVCLDPGIGFGKTVAHNLELVRRLDELAAIGRPLLVGISRKSTLGKVTGDPMRRSAPPPASVGGAVSAFDRGASILRVHDVREHVEALAVAKAVAG